LIMYLNLNMFDANKTVKNILLFDYFLSSSVQHL